ncbi:MAG: hypothetical protein H5T63_00525 [Chloroflexi bacterium]|nr:hypothetical protein [Chloroflexota bacterium]
MRRLTLLLLAGLLLLSCGACSSQATPATLSKPTESTAMASASPTPEEIIQVTVVEPISKVTRNDTYYFDNCSGIKERRQSLGTVAQVQKNLTLGSEATATDSSQKTSLSEECRAKIMLEVEKAYQDKIAALQTEVDQQEMVAGAYSRFNYTIIWEEWQFNSTVSLTLNGQSYTVPYTYTLLVPSLGSAKSVPCSG